MDDMGNTAVRIENKPKVIETEAFLQWVYQQQKAHKETDAATRALEAREAGLRAVVSVTGAICDRLRNAAAAGVTVDSFGVPSGLGRLDADAQAAHEFVERLEPEVQALVILHAVRGDRPDWHPGPAAWWEPVWRHDPIYGPDGRPRPGSFLLSPGDDGRPKAACPVVLRRAGGVGAAYVDTHRIRWLMWVTGLTAVYRHFAGRPGSLSRHRLTRPMVAVAPWDCSKGD